MMESLTAMILCILLASSYGKGKYVCFYIRNIVSAVEKFNGKTSN